MHSNHVFASRYNLEISVSLLITEMFLMHHLYPLPIPSAPEWNMKVNFE